MEELNPDTLTILRVLVKISSVIENLDDVMYSERYYKQQLKKEVPLFMSEVEKTVDPIMITLMKQDDETYPLLLKALSDYSKEYVKGDEERLSILFVYAKLESALNDVEELSWATRNESHLVISILPRIKSLKSCIEKMYPHIINAVDKDGNEVKSIVTRIDELSKMIIKL